ncbi:hypothetical protein AJ80_04254 [Polytolypa hystricis UAMH7299]|uniref:Uncharacterized protein n=1 Tax=Polytolypa hystricis (strain UAMH7299) TaxID=1447883 RepID=A0A2B7YE91_POLH7|nr:hypothetical protein AJ80_04254 [Polytolypa hystricis UAMH7299]
MGGAGAKCHFLRTLGPTLCPMGLKLSVGVGPSQDKFSHLQTLYRTKNMYALQARCLSRFSKYPTGESLGEDPRGLDVPLPCRAAGTQSHTAHINGMAYVPSIVLDLTLLEECIGWIARVKANTEIAGTPPDKQTSHRAIQRNGFLIRKHVAQVSDLASSSQTDGRAGDPCQAN